MKLIKLLLLNLNVVQSPTEKKTHMYPNRYLLHMQLYTTH